MSEHEHDDFQYKYVGYVILALILGVFGIGIAGIVYLTMTCGGLC